MTRRQYAYQCAGLVLDRNMAKMPPSHHVGREVKQVSREHREHLPGHHVADRKRLGRSPRHLGDVSRHEYCVGLIEAAVERFGHLDILVCNAAIRRQVPFLQMTFEQWREVIGTDLDSVFCAFS